MTPSVSEKKNQTLSDVFSTLEGFISDSLEYNKKTDKAFSAQKCKLSNKPVMQDSVKVFTALSCVNVCSIQ